MSPLDVDVRDVAIFPYCTVEEVGIRDGLSGAVIPVNEVGRAIVSLCDGTRDLAAVAESVAARSGAAPEVVLSDLVVFLDSAERRGLVRIRRSLRVRLTASALLHRFLALLALRLNRSEQRRYPAGAIGCAAATIRSTRMPLWLGLACVPILSYALAVQPNVPVTGAFIAALAPLVAVVLVQLTIWLHEMGHLLALSPPARTTAYFQARPLQVTLSYSRRLVTNHWRVALAGPSAGVVACLGMSAALSSTNLPSGTSLLPLVVALGHLFSLAPWAHDGRLLMGAARADVVDDPHVAA
jgi:hypothetical protein